VERKEVKMKSRYFGNNLRQNIFKDKKKEEN